MHRVHLGIWVLLAIQNLAYKSTIIYTKICVRGVLKHILDVLVHVEVVAIDQKSTQSTRKPPKNQFLKGFVYRGAIKYDT